MNQVDRLSQLGQIYWLKEVKEPSDLTEVAVQQAIRTGFSGASGCTLLTPETLQSGELYDNAILGLVENQRGIDAGGIYERLILQDYSVLADLWSNEYAPTTRARGLVAVPVAPQVSDDPTHLRAEARRIARKLNRRNITVKIPSSPATFSAIPDLIADNVSVYITNIRDREYISQLLDAYRTGLERRAASGKLLNEVHCLAGVNIAGIDNAVDALLDEAIEFESSLERQIELEQKKGRAAIATARLSAAIVSHRSRSAQWNALQRQQANPLHLVWENLRETQACGTASYFKNLIGPNTICCLSQGELSDLAAVSDGTVSLNQGFSQAQMLFSELARLGLDLQQRIESEDAQHSEDERDRFLAVLEIISERRASLSFSP